VTQGRLTHVDLFSGIGGFTLGFEASGHFVTKLLADSDRSAATTFKRNRPRVPFWTKDLSQVDGKQLLTLMKMESEQLDVLTAGPPCQGFSRLGTRQLDDPRNVLLKRTAVFLGTLRPKLAIIENVPALSWDGHSALYDEFCDVLAAAGYEPRAKVLEAWRYGVPQMRRRLFILAVRNDMSVPNEPFPEGERSETFTARELIRSADAGEPICPPGLSVEEAIGDLPSIEAGGGAEAMSYPPVKDELSDYQRARRVGAAILFNHKARAHSPAMLQKMAMIREGGRNQELPDEDRLRADPEREYFSQAYGRLHRHGIAQTVTTMFHNPGSGRFTHYRDLRALTVREAARFQSFDDRYMLLGKLEWQMRHVGNAVPVLLAKTLANMCSELITGIRAKSDEEAVANAA
jgi:DNA (cytosine-5)-methyltransferase 1